MLDEVEVDSCKSLHQAVIESDIVARGSVVLIYAYIYHIFIMFVYNCLEYLYAYTVDQGLIFAVSLYNFVLFFLTTNIYVLLCNIAILVGMMNILALL